MKPVGGGVAAVEGLENDAKSHAAGGSFGNYHALTNELKPHCLEQMRGKMEVETLRGVHRLWQRQVPFERRRKDHCHDRDWRSKAHFPSTLDKVSQRLFSWLQFLRRISTTKSLLCRDFHSRHPLLLLNSSFDQRDSLDLLSETSQRKISTWKAD